ncbi:unnamed protein product [Closterium sp. NIES-53]
MAPTAEKLAIAAVAIAAAPAKGVVAAVAVGSNSSKEQQQQGAAPGPPPVDPLPPQGPASSGVSQIDPLPLAEPVKVTIDSGADGGGATRGAASGGAEPAGGEPRGAEPASAEPGGAELEGAEPEGAESKGAESRGAEPRGNASAGGRAGASPRQSRRWEPLSPRQLREWFAQRSRLRNGATGARGPAVGRTGAGGAGAPSPGGAGVTGGAGGTGGAGAAGPGGARTRDPGAGDPGAGGAGAGGARAGGTGAGGTVQRRSFFIPPPPSSLPPPGLVLRQVLSLPSSTDLTPRSLCPPPHQSQPQLQLDSSLPAPSPYAEQTDSLEERREHASRPASPVRAVRIGRRVPHLRPPPVPGTHIMALRPSSVPLRVPLPSPPASSLAHGPDPESDLARAASPTVTRLLATIVTDPSFESTASSALVPKLVHFAAACRLDYATSLVAESDCPPSVGGECALGTDVLEDKQDDFECLAYAIPHLEAMLLAPEGDPNAPGIPTLRSYAEAVTVPPLGANLADGMWIFRVKRTPGSLPVFKVRYVARGFSQRQGVDFFQTFSPNPKMTTLRVLRHVAAERDYELHSLDFSTAFLHCSLHEEIWLRRPPGFTGSFPAGTQWSLRRPVHGLR